MLHHHNMGLSEVFSMLHKFDAYRSTIVEGNILYGFYFEGEIRSVTDYWMLQWHIIYTL